MPSKGFVKCQVLNVAALGDGGAQLQPPQSALPREEKAEWALLAWFQRPSGTGSWRVLCRMSRCQDQCWV